MPEYSDPLARHTMNAQATMRRVDIFLADDERQAVENRMSRKQHFADLVRMVAASDQDGLQPALAFRPISPGCRKRIKVMLPEDQYRHIKESAKCQRLTPSEYLMRRLLALPVIPGALARPRRPRRILDTAGRILALEVRIESLLREYFNLIGRHGTVEGIAETRALLEVLATEIRTAIHEGQKA